MTALESNCVDVDGVLLTVIPDGRVALVEMIHEEEEEEQPLPPPEFDADSAENSSGLMKKKIMIVTPLEGESYYEPSTETMEHMVDVCAPTCAMVFHVSVSGREIKRAKRLI